MLLLLQRDQEDVRLDLARGDHSRAAAFMAILDESTSFALNELERRQVSQAYMMSYLEAIPTLQARWSGDFSGGLPALAPRSGVATTAAAPVPALKNADASAATPVSKAPLLSHVSMQFLQHQRAGRIWDQQTLGQARKTFELAIEIVGDRPLDQYGRQDANKVRAVLQELPADYGQAAIFRGQSAPGILEIDKKRQPQLERLSSRTVKRHLSVLSALWKWQLREGAQLSNAFQGFSFPSSKRANEQREMWNSEDLRALFASPVWSGCKSAVRRAEPGTTIIRDEKFWLPLIALFSGMRQEEICQLQVEDIRQVDGHWAFDLNARPPRKLKNRNAVRLVPIHPELIRMRLLDYFLSQKNAGSSALFPDLAPGGADDRLGHSFSKWFARYRQAIGIYKKGLDFHSLRHTATTLLYRAGVSGPLIDELTGHATPGETARYSHGSTMKQRADAISQIRPELDLEVLHT